LAQASSVKFGNSWPFVHRSHAAVLRADRNGLGEHDLRGVPATMLRKDCVLSNEAVGLGQPRGRRHDRVNAAAVCI